MTEYKGTKGGAVQNFEEDPGNPYVGQVWYNETTGNLRVRQTTLTSAYAAGGNLNTAKQGSGSAGTQTATLLFGGGNPPPVTGDTELYNGSTWTEVNNLNTGRSGLDNAGAGTQTAGLAFGGGITPASALTETFNGTNWTEVNDMNSAKKQLGGVGTQTSALAFAGENPGNPVLAITESWNGTNWTEVND